MKLNQQLPIGVSTFEEIINQKLLYIDKTEIIHTLITRNKRCFLSRPRRFGKSLMISTIKEIFSGDKELFKKLWIGQDGRYNWISRPVICLDFSEFKLADVDTLNTGLNLILDVIARQHGCDISLAHSPENKLSLLIRELGSKSPQKIVVLVDEYDAPLREHVDNPTKATPIRDVLKSFYTTLKSLDAYIHFTLVTGVTKFAKTSLFSGPNNLDDISMDAEYATICGYTESEINNNLNDYLIDLAAEEETSLEETKIKMRTWYNGYRFSAAESSKVYNPFSVMLCFNFGKTDVYFNYAQPSPKGYGGQPSLCQSSSFTGLPAEACESEGWFSTGTPTFLIKMIQNKMYTFNNLDHSSYSKSMLDTFEIGDIPLAALLYQTGYLTLEAYDRQSQTYTLTFPNEEVRQSINRSLIAELLQLNKGLSRNSIITKRL